MKSFVTVEGLKKAYPLPGSKVSIPALRGVSFTVREGEMVGLMGKSGSGKTTLLRILRGVERFDGGSVRIGKISLRPTSPRVAFDKVKETTAIHLQRSFSLWAETVVENVIRKLRKVQTGIEDVPYNKESEEYKTAFDAAMRILKLVGLERKADFLFGILSGGEKQCVLLARQLAKKPSLLLLDEPATMSDPGNRRVMLDAVKRANEAGTTVVFASHNPKVHEYLADRVIWLEEGKIREVGKSKVLEGFKALLDPPLQLSKPASRPRLILRLQNVWKRYRLIVNDKLIQTLEMKDVSLDVHQGEIFAIVGPRGAGKTVILRLLAGLDLPDRGRILHRAGDRWVNVGKLGLEALKVRQGVDMMHQEFSLPFYQSIASLFAYRLGIKSQEAMDQVMKTAEELGLKESTLDLIFRCMDMPEAEAKAVLEGLGLDEGEVEDLFPEFPLAQVEKEAEPILEMLNLPGSLLDRHPYELSVGERLRMAIGLHLVTRPRIFILDEPFGDLDPYNLRCCANALKRVNREMGTTMVIVSHQAEVIEELAGRGALIVEGELKKVGPAKEVCDLFLQSDGETGLDGV